MLILKLTPDCVVRLEFPGGGVRTLTRQMLPGHGAPPMAIVHKGITYGTVVGAERDRLHWAFDLGRAVAVRRVWIGEGAA